MDAAACRVVYIDDRFHSEKWISREGSKTTITPQKASQTGLNDLPFDLQANVKAILSLFNQGMCVLLSANQPAQRLRCMSHLDADSDFQSSSAIQASHFPSSFP